MCTEFPQLSQLTQSISFSESPRGDQHLARRVTMNPLPMLIVVLRQFTEWI